MVQRRTFQTPATAPETAGEALTEPADESVASVAADVTPVADSALARAQQALQETTELLKALTVRRREVLLTGSDEDVAAVDAEIEAAQRVQRTRTDRVAVLLEHAAEEAAAARAAARSETIAGIELLLSERDRIGGELSASIESADRAFVRLVELGREIRQRWQFAPHDANPALLSENAIAQAVPHEIFRLTARPHPLGGKILTDHVPSFPAASKAERIEHAQQPEKIRPLVSKLADASALASKVMRTGFSTNQLSAIPSGSASPGEARPSNVEPLPTTSPFKAEPNPELARLLSRQNQLANKQTMTDEDEAEYAANGRQIAAIS
jgi:hypothetical protein